MTYDPRGVSFRGCRNREEVMARFTAWLDAYYADQLRTVAAHWLLEDGDLTDITDCVVQLRGEFARSRAECLAAVTQALDQARRP